MRQTIREDLLEKLRLLRLLLRICKAMRVGRLDRVSGQGQLTLAVRRAWIDSTVVRICKRRAKENDRDGRNEALPYPKISAE